MPDGTDAVYTLDGGEHHLDRIPTESHAARLDNVPREESLATSSPAVNEQVPHGTVTHYWPLDAAAPADERQRALARTHGEWCERVVADLDRMHPGIHSSIRNIDVWVWGHGMIRPVPGFIWGKGR